MAYVKDSIFIQAPPEKVHAFAIDPRNWCRWFVGLAQIESQQGDGSPGTTVSHTYLMAGAHFPLTTRVIEDRAEPDGSFHWKAENEGALAGRLSWDYLPKDDGTQVEIHMEYTIPGDFPGELASRLFIERNQERAAHLTLQNLKHLIEE
ncbi:MAG: SRPBCC family protein [Actinobacteria bacterium]|nr:SRPBCC family protein [Actinomycetota bacterium]